MINYLLILFSSYELNKINNLNIFGFVQRPAHFSTYRILMEFEMMKFSILKKVLIFIPNKVAAINKNLNKLITFPDKVGNTFTYVTKVTGATTGIAGAAKGSVDLAEAIACQDGICAFISAVGVAADGLQICTSFIPGPNITSIVTIPISVGCKVFVWCCKRSKLPWVNC